jgi:BirA family biotin operon repressor/biotin-[acetyl-CoA-carboxylase] ligase
LDPRRAMTDTPYAVCELEQTGSTQDEARRRFTGAPLLVVAARQSAGRGRRGAAWVSAPRAVAATLAWRPGWPEAAWPRLTLAAGLAACRVLGEQVGLEWPNDLVVAEGKVGGLLAEAGPDGVLVGMGVNLYWPRPEVAGAAALLAGDPGPAAAGQIAHAWAADLLARTAGGPGEWGVDDYARRCLTLGREVTWEPRGRGRALQVQADGGLVVEVADGRLVLYAGEVHTIRAR